jgi:predicted nucleotidyltransferase component of viral defense system
LDIAAMKLIAISQRGSRKDFYDLHAVLQRIAFRQITSRLTEMYDPRRLNPMHLAKLLVYFDDAEGEPEPQLLHRTDWASVRQWFEERIREYTQILLEETAKP